MKNLMLKHSRLVIRLSTYGATHLLFDTPHIKHNVINLSAALLHTRPGSPFRRTCMPLWSRICLRTTCHKVFHLITAEHFHPDIGCSLP
jgi:hypothetical protein